MNAGKTIRAKLADRGRVAKARERGKVTQKLHEEVDREDAEEAAISEAVSRFAAWSRRQYILNNPTISPALEANLLEG